MSYLAILRARVPRPDCNFTHSEHRIAAPHSRIMKLRSGLLFCPFNCLPHYTFFPHHLYILHAFATVSLYGTRITLMVPLVLVLCSYCVLPAEHSFLSGDREREREEEKLTKKKKKTWRTSGQQAWQD